MLVHAKLDAVFSAGCPLSVIAHTLLLTHHRRLTLRELGPTNASRSKGERGRYSTFSPPCDGNPLCLSFYRRLLAARSVARPTTT